MAEETSVIIIEEKHHLEALELLAFAQVRIVKTPDEAKSATNDLTIISKLTKAMEAKKKELLQPHKVKMEDIRASYNTLMAPVLEADVITRGKVIVYQKELAERQAKQEEINRKRLEAAQEEMKLKGELTEAVDLVEVQEAPKRISTDMGAAGFTDNWKYEVFDFVLLPDEFKVADTAMLNSIAKKHHDQKKIQGVRFYNEPILTVRPQ